MAHLRVISELEAIAHTEAMRHEPRQAIQPAAGLAKIREDRGLILVPYMRHRETRWLSIAKRLLSSKGVKRATEEGRDMTLEELTSLAANEE